MPLLLYIKKKSSKSRLRFTRQFYFRLSHLNTFCLNTSRYCFCIKNSQGPHSFWRNQLYKIQWTLSCLFRKIAGASIILMAVEICFRTPRSSSSDFPEDLFQYESDNGNSDYRQSRLNPTCKDNLRNIEIRIWAILLLVSNIMAIPLVNIIY